MPRHVPHGRDLRLRGRTFSPGQTGLLAIINRTPDSFYDAGRYLDDDLALSAVALAVADGADAVDIGGVKAGPGPEVSAAEELRRVVSFIGAVRQAHPNLVISVDTWRADAALAAGVREDGLLIDAAQDFGKNTYHSLQVTGQVSALIETRWPVLLAVSNKKFIAETLGMNGSASDRITGTLATTAVGVWEGVRMVRAHDVAATRQVLDMVAGLRSGIPALARRH